jgi:hypothetical protein
VKKNWGRCQTMLVVFALSWICSSWYKTDAQPLTKLGVLDTHGIVLRDQNGVIKARLGTRSDGSPAFAFLDDTGRTRVEMGLRGDGLPSIQLLDNKGSPRLVLGLEDNEGTFIVVNGSSGRRVFELSALADDTVQQFFFDQSGGQRIRLVVKPEGKAEVCIVGSKERPGVWMGVSKEGDARQSVFGRDGKERITMNVDASGSSLNFLTAERKGRIVMSVMPDGTALNALYDRNGHRKIGSYVDTSGFAREVLFGRSGEPAIVLSSEGEAPASFRCYDVNGVARIGFAVGRDGEPSFLVVRSPETERRYSNRVDISLAGKSKPVAARP